MTNDLAAADALIRANIATYADVILDLSPEYDEDPNFIYLLGAAGIAHDDHLAKIEEGLKRLATNICLSKFLDLAVLVGAAVEAADATKH